MHNELHYRTIDVYHYTHQAIHLIRSVIAQVDRILKCYSEEGDKSYLSRLEGLIHDHPLMENPRDGLPAEVAVYATRFCNEIELDEFTIENVDEEWADKCCGLLVAWQRVLGPYLEKPRFDTIVGSEAVEKTEDLYSRFDVDALYELAQRIGEELKELQDEVGLQIVREEVFESITVRADDIKRFHLAAVDPQFDREKYIEENPQILDASKPSYLGRGKVCFQSETKLMPEELAKLVEYLLDNGAASREELEFHACSKPNQKIRNWITANPEYGPFMKTAGIKGNGGYQIKFFDERTCRKPNE